MGLEAGSVWAIHSVDIMSPCRQYVSVRIISPSTLKKYAEKHAKAEAALSAWQTIVENKRWRNSNDVKNTFNSVDIYVTLLNKRTLYIFDICIDAFRLICAIHFPKNETQEGWVYVRNFLTHAEYKRNK
jgi:mRNA-degrading endonuclease HigB of HigAB toxin-antitoxin module